MASRCGNPQCDGLVWHWRRVHGESVLEFSDPLPFCVECGQAWPIETFASAAIRSRDDTRKPWEYELAMAWPMRLGVVRGIAVRMQAHSRTRWPARVYLTYLKRFANGGALARRAGRLHRGGVRALLVHARREWPRAPHAWTYHQVVTLIHEGRLAFAARCARAGIIAPFEVVAEQTTSQCYWQHPEPLAIADKFLDDGADSCLPGPIKRRIVRVQSAPGVAASRPPTSVLAS